MTQARAMIQSGSYTKQQIAETFNVSRATLYRNIQKAALQVPN
ncbi:helix-turn-helix domain-containing protein [Arthrobacter gengyunqii]|uniref:Helix-turn-helix domain-containing protein n=1 Tax=Arthrobacter gengyunqii TaxID=2886940 RepID=A0ABS8GF26_9MICC|nr:helix-turn-helix domain-containing protein [Arthrobacter gengyunqii]